MFSCLGDNTQFFSSFENHFNVILACLCIVFSDLSVLEFAFEPGSMANGFFTSFFKLLTTFVVD